MTLPLGGYKGRVKGPLGFLLNRIWKGKFFHSNTVENKILGHWMFPGYVSGKEPGLVIISYPQLGIEDHLFGPDRNGNWTGEMTRILGIKIRFTLEKIK